MANTHWVKFLTNYVIFLSLTKFCAPVIGNFRLRFRSSYHLTSGFNIPNTDIQYGHILHKKIIAENNLEVPKRIMSSWLRDGEVIIYNPHHPAPPFTLTTLTGKYVFPQSKRNHSTIIHVFNTDSAFLDCLWASDEALQPLVHAKDMNNTDFIFIAKSAHYNEEFGALWMKKRLETIYRKEFSGDGLLPDRYHFAVEPLYQLGNYIPAVLRQWQCVDHLCGLDQVQVKSQGLQYPVVLKRLDARYDWLPSAPSAFGNKTLSLVFAWDGCEKLGDVNGSVVLISYHGNCSVFNKIRQMQASGAAGVIIMADKNQPIRDLNCEGEECSVNLHIPVSMVTYHDGLLVPGEKTVCYQNTPSENFFMAIDMAGNLAEVGWFLYPNMSFLVWQAQWFSYKNHLSDRIKSDALTVNIFKDRIMQGQAGVSVNITLPELSELRSYKEMLLDMSLGCPGNRDVDCAHWDHTVNLYVCCESQSSLCNMELGRWITPFRRRIGRWLSDVSPLLPLLTSRNCMFTMKTAPWAMPWVPSLDLHFQDKQSQGGIYPAEAVVLYEPGAIFDKNYNSHFKPYKFILPQDTVKTEVYAVITGHGSDENGCGEFCVTSHHFAVNKHINNITFSDAGTPFGCADQVQTGVEPNEHGTWLYGRDGWCDGRNVFPWVIDVTQQVQKGQQTNVILYFGWFNGTDPDPKQNPGEMILYSYLVFYKELNKR